MKKEAEERDKRLQLGNFRKTFHLLQQPCLQLESIQKASTLINLQIMPPRLTLLNQVYF